MRRLLAMSTAVFVYLCVGTVITGCLLTGYALSKGYLDKEKVAKMVAVAQGLETQTPRAGATPEILKPAETPEQPSLDEIENKRAIQVRNLELREQAISRALDEARFEQRKLADEKGSYDRLKTTFEKQLADLHTGAQATGRENIRLIWENIRPKQAKEQMLQMMSAGEQADVVAILSAMPINKRAKIVGEFKTDDEAKKLEEILRLIRQGMPEEKVINQAEKEFKETAPTGARGVAGASNLQGEIATK